jgi:DNA-directed RNA polymerase alpha subunit
MSIIRNKKKLDDNTLSFEMHGVDISIPNAIRRILIAKIPTFAFSTIKIISNKTSINNDMLKTRIELIPLKSTDPDIANAEFKLRVNAEDETVDVFSESLKSSDGKKYFPDNLLLLTLKPKQSIELTCSAIKDIPSVNYKHSPVGTAVLQYLPDENLIKKLPKDATVLDKERAYLRDTDGNPSVKIIIESLGNYPVDKLYDMTCEIIIEKLEFLKSAIKQENPEKLQIIEFKPMDNTFDYIINKEDHTLGMLINNQNLKNKNCSYTGMLKSHPLEEKIIIRIGASKGKTNDIILESIEELIKIFNKIL